MKHGIVKMSVLLVGLFILPRMGQAIMAPSCNGFSTAGTGPDFLVSWTPVQGAAAYGIWVENPASQWQFYWAGNPNLNNYPFKVTGGPGTYYANVSAQDAYGNWSSEGWCPTGATVAAPTIPTVKLMDGGLGTCSTVSSGATGSCHLYKVTGNFYYPGCMAYGTYYNVASLSGQPTNEYYSHNVGTTEVDIAVKQGYTISLYMATEEIVYSSSYPCYAIVANESNPLLSGN